MTRARLLALLVVLSGCAGPEPLPTSAFLDVDGPTDVVATLEDRALVRGEASSPLAQTDERPSYEMEVRGTTATLERSPGRVLTGALTEQGVVWLLPDGTLQRGDGTLIDREVLPELAVDAEGRMLAYPRHTRVGGGVVVLDLASGQRRIVTEGLAVADRPLFLADGRLVVVGARASGVSGIWIADATGALAPLPVTNAELRTGRPLGAGFVPPPAYHASMRVVGDVLVYDDGRGEQRVRLPADQGGVR